MSQEHLETLWREGFAKSLIGKGFTTQEITRLWDPTKIKCDYLQKGELYAIAGVQLHDVRLVVDGSLRAEMVGPNGKQLLMDLLGVGRVVAPALIFASKNELPVTLFAEENSIIMRIDRKYYKEMLREYPQLVDNMLHILSDISCFLMRKIHLLSLRSLQGKLADYLLLHFEKLGTKKNVTIHSSWKELADRFGVNRQSLARTLSQMEDAGHIQVNGKEITILNADKLARLE